MAGNYTNNESKYIDRKIHSMKILILIRSVISADNFIRGRSTGLRRKES
nr:MAG TPA: hypothetical protein [Caudoviricetes sp.]